MRGCGVMRVGVCAVLRVWKLARPMRTFAEMKMEVCALTEVFELMDLAMTDSALTTESSRCPVSVEH